MTEVVVLDSGPLGLISHPRPTSDILVWLARLVADDAMVCVPEIADYEVRRELLRAGRMKGIRRLDAYKANLHYLPITTEAMLKAAEFWAEARRHGSHEHSLDADMILAAQAVTCTTRSVVVASMNAKHLRHFVSANRWEDIN
jgi:predicted nucleic acid-binding protein